MKRDYQLLKDKLAELQHKDKHFTVFGSKKHRYMLAPPLSEKQVKDFEKKLTITLPQEYRDFLQEIGGSGAGPYYGLCPLQEALDDEEIKDLIAQPFVSPSSYKRIMELLERDRNAVPRRTINGHLQPADAASMNIYCPAPGILPLCEQGCAFYTGLVITGAEAGTMWDYIDVGWVPTYYHNAYSLQDEHDELLVVKSSTNIYEDHTDYCDFLLSSKNKQRLGFYDWYNGWLDSALAQLDGYIYPDKGIGVFRLYDDYKTVTARLKNNYKTIDHGDFLIIQTHTLHFYFSAKIGYRLSKIEVMKDFKGKLCLDKTIIFSFHAGTALEKIEEITIQKDRDDQWILPDTPGVCFEVHDGAISNISIYKDEATEDTTVKIHLLEQWILELAQESLQRLSPFSDEVVQKALQSMVTHLLSLQRNKTSLALAKIIGISKNTAGSVKKRSVLSLSQDIIAFYNATPSKVWWYRLPERWKAIFIYTQKLAKDPSSSELKKILNLTTLECSVDRTLRTISLDTLEPLQPLKKLEKLVGYNTNIDSLEPLKNNTDLKILQFSSSKIDSVKPLDKLLNLREFSCTHAPLASLEGLEKMSKLTLLAFNETRVKDLKPLKNLHTLKKLEFYHTKVRSLRPLQNLYTLEELLCGYNTIRTMRSLRHLKKLRVLNINSTKISSIDDIVHLENLESLSLAGTTIQDLEPLGALKKLRELNLNFMPITSLKAVWNLPLQELYCLQTKISKKEISRFKKDHPSCTMSI